MATRLPHRQCVCRHRRFRMGSVWIPICNKHMLNKLLGWWLIWCFCISIMIVTCVPTPSTTPPPYHGSVLCMNSFIRSDIIRIHSFLPPLDFLHSCDSFSGTMCAARCICGEFAVHLRCICGAFAVHLRGICGAFAVHLWLHLRCICGAFNNNNNNNTHICTRQCSIQLNNILTRTSVYK